MSFCSIGRHPGMLVFSGNLYCLMNLAIGVLAGREVKPTSTSFLGLSDLCQYVVMAIGVGITTPAV
jgi:hypothetical protein